jgi:hypothetical protein
MPASDDAAANAVPHYSPDFADRRPFGSLSWTVFADATRGRVDSGGNTWVDPRLSSLPDVGQPPRAGGSIWRTAPFAGSTRDFLVP